MKVTILGAGAFGTALGTILEENYHSINFYDPIKHPDVSIKAATKDADAVIVAAPSEFVPDLLKNLPENTRLINTSKGFLSLKPFAKFSDFGILSGASFASSILEKKPTTFTTNSEFAEKLFKTSWTTFEHSDDLLGILLCGSFKNIYAIGAGLKGLKPNTKKLQQYLDDCLLELRAILAANNCDPETAELSCGRGDLFITCSSTESRNYQYGAALLAGQNPAENATVEGVSAINELEKSDLKLPPLKILDDIIKEVKNAAK